MESIVPLFLVILGAVVLGYALFGLKDKKDSAQVLPATKEPITTNSNQTTKPMDEHTHLAAVKASIQPAVTNASFGVWTGFKLGFGFTLGAFLATLLLMLIFGFVFAGAIASMAANFFSGFLF